MRREFNENYKHWKNVFALSTEPEAKHMRSIKGQLKPLFRICPGAWTTYHNKQFCSQLKSVFWTRQCYIMLLTCLWPDHKTKSLLWTSSLFPALSSLFPFVLSSLGPFFSFLPCPAFSLFPLMIWKCIARTQCSSEANLTGAFLPKVNKELHVMENYFSQWNQCYRI